MKTTVIILNFAAFAVLVGLYLSERKDRNWWMEHATKCRKLAENCLGLAEKYFYKGMVQHKKSGERLQVYGVQIIPPDLTVYLLIFVDGKWEFIPADDCEPVTTLYKPETPTEGQTYVYTEGKTCQTEETITATM